MPTDRQSCCMSPVESSADINPYTELNRGEFFSLGGADNEDA